MFDTFLEKYTIEVVVNRTKISRRNLEKLREGDFHGFTRPQAVGFIRILEREFEGEDFTDLKNRLDAYLEEAPTAGNEPIFAGERREVPAGGSSKGWIFAVVIVAIAVVGFLLFRKEFSAPSQPPAEGVAKQAPAPGAKPGGEVAPPQAQKSDMPAATEASTAEAAPSAAPAAEAEPEEAATAPDLQASTPGKEKTEEPYVPLEPVALEPSVKLWLGIIDLKTKKRIAKVTAQPYEIDSHGRKLLVTGHGRFEISDAFGNLFKFNDAKKHYFLIDEGMVSEITAAEFRKLNGGKGW